MLTTTRRRHFFRVAATMRGLSVALLIATTLPATADDFMSPVCKIKAVKEACNIPLGNTEQKYGPVWCIGYDARMVAYRRAFLDGMRKVLVALYPNGSAKQHAPCAFLRKQEAGN